MGPSVIVDHDQRLKNRIANIVSEVYFGGGTEQIGGYRVRRAESGDIEIVDTEGGVTTLSREKSEAELYRLLKSV